MRIIKGLSGKSKGLRIPLFALFCLLFGSALQAQSNNHKPNIAPSEYTEKGISQGWMEGQQIPDFAVNDVFNKKFKLYDLLDKPLIIEFFTLDNAQSQKNKKYLRAFYNQYNINILGICTDEYIFQIQDVNKDHQLPWSNVQDNSKKFGGKTFAQNAGLENVSFLIILPGGVVHKVFPSETNIGKVGVELQKYFKG